MTETLPQLLPDGLGDNLGWLLAQCFRAHAAALDRAVAGIPHGLRGFQALCGAVHGSARNQAELGRQLDLDRTVMVYLVDDLAGAGLVERVTDPADRRNKLVRATAAGKARFAEARAAIAEAESAVLSPLDPAERGQFREMLRSLASHHLASSKETDPCELAIRVTESEGSPSLTSKGR
ncbi:winged helix DNA-binding protein [Amycolatopsis rhizosphaerae]|uniref:Winged helix DNA-binding protein n=1 Tax=Amycolatopsis rhizosphaerae TaxID=2053003 RepID=A0A558BBQ9_9PSEU|nr:winged helix DNA-binding protein [Amycolatopsis rhizosphaerae]TVT33930.1 winged helix DNA-binding protein [Amycolatopsis rhizosphaerae]